MAIFRTALLLSVLTGIFLGIGLFLGGTDGMFIGLVFAGLINFAAYFWSDKIVLAMYHAKPSHDKKLNAIVEKLAENAKMPKPKVYIISTESPNAFATGRSPSHAAVAATEGILKILTEAELEGVIAHELAHVKNRDTLIGTMAATMAGAISFLSRMLLFGDDDNRNIVASLAVMILAPVAAMLIQMAISRNREFGADYTGAIISKKPAALATALEKISNVSKNHPMKGNPSTAHLFIVNPFKASNVFKLFSTHPPVEERIKRLYSIKI